MPTLTVLAAGGVMGADYLVGRGWDVTTLPLRSQETQAQDTCDAVEAMVDADVHLILFVGGDGTARDVATKVGEVPALGVPAGVKMHSGVFATTPETAGNVAGRYLAYPGAFPTRDGEVVDRDEQGVLRLFGTLRVPAVPTAVQARKGISAGGGEDVTALAHELAAEMVPGWLYLLGPGTTVGAVGEALGLDTTPLGVDAVLDGRLVARDASEVELLALLAQHPRARLILGVVGGQGFLLGRGNQQLSPAVISAVGAENIEILAAPAKVASLEEPILHIDIDDADLAASLVGYRRVRTGRARSTVLKVVA
jgi:predicted polyphosphate/ATP-dependent NAD kinase